MRQVVRWADIRAVIKLYPQGKTAYVHIAFPARDGELRFNVFFLRLLRKLHKMIAQYAELIC
jgi:hypothetical protein